MGLSIVVKELATLVLVAKLLPGACIHPGSSTVTSSRWAPGSALRAHGRLGAGVQSVALRHQVGHSAAHLDHVALKFLKMVLQRGLVGAFELGEQLQVALDSLVVLGQVGDHRVVSWPIFAVHLPKEAKAC